MVAGCVLEIENAPNPLIALILEFSEFSTVASNFLFLSFLCLFSYVDDLHIGSSLFSLRVLFWFMDSSFQTFFVL